MPYGDRTGPEGKGPRTGRGLGYCSDRNAPGYTADAAPRGMGYGRGPGRGFGRGRGAGYGRGRGRGLGRAPAFSPADEKEWLENEKKAIEKRLKELEE